MKEKVYVSTGSLKQIIDCEVSEAVKEIENTKKEIVELKRQTARIKADVDLLKETKLDKPLYSKELEDASKYLNDYMKSFSKLKQDAFKKKLKIKRELSAKKDNVVRNDYLARLWIDTIIVLSLLIVILTTISFIL